MKTIEFHGIQCVEISNGRVTLLVTQSVGPRVISLSYEGGENIFAVIPDVTLDCPGVGPYHLYGGHRLWHAPEEPGVTYLPDDTEVVIEQHEQSLRLIQETEPKTGIQKRIDIRMHDDRALVSVDHILTNQGDAPFELAPWAITQLKLGGAAILPQSVGPLGDNPTLPNRAITLWPYTDVRSEHIEWGNEFVLVHANVKQGHLKIGYPNPTGWLGYWIDSTLFIKHSEFNPNGEYYDFSSSSECYCNDHFLELETLGEKAILSPGNSVSHTETWELHRIGQRPEEVDQLNLVLSRLIQREPS